MYYVSTFNSIKKVFNYVQYIFAALLIYKKYISRDAIYRVPTQLIA